MMPHVKQFILKHHGTEPVRLELSSMFMKLLCSHMTKAKTHSDADYPSLNTVMDFEINETYASVYGHSINKCQAYQFNDIVDGIMREILFARLDLLTKLSDEMKKRTQIKMIIEDFQLEYGLDDEHISYDTLKKDYYRWSTKRSLMQSKLFYHELSLKRAG